MSELGQNEGQEQSKDAPFFDSSKIANKKDVEHFANVEGAEERARKAEQAKKAAEKEAQEVHAADIRAASEQMKKQENAETSRKRGGVIGFLFGGWHKIVTIVVLLALAVGGVFLFMLTTGESEEAITERGRSAAARAQAIYDEAEGVRQDGTYEEAKKKFEDALVDCNREEKIYITVRYAEYVAFVGQDSETAYALIDSVKNETKTDQEKECISNGLRSVEMYTGVEYE